MSSRLFALSIALTVLTAGCASTDPAPVPEMVAVTASFDTAPGTQPAVPRLDVTAAMAFDAQLEQLLTGKPSDLDTSALPDDERELLSGVIESIAGFRRALRSDSSLTATRVAPLLELSARIHAQAPLDIPTLALCRSVQQFGVFEPFDVSHIPAGRETQAIIYCEVDHFSIRPSSDGKWETRLSYEATLYTDDEKATVALAKKPASIIDRCRNRRRDFFLADRVTLPADIAPGRYVLRVTIVDQLANRVAEKSVPVVFAANGS